MLADPLTKSLVNVALVEVKLLVTLASRQVVPTWHVGVGRRAHQLENTMALIKIRLPLQDGLSFEHLSENTSHTPHVNRRRVPPQGKQQLRRTIPPRHNKTGIIPHSVSIPITRQRGLTLVVPCKPKVSNLEDALIRNQEIRSLHISMQDM